MLRRKDPVHLLLVNVNGDRVIRHSKLVRIGEIFQHEVQNHVAGLDVVMRIHCHFPEQIPYLPVIYDDSTQSVPEVIKGEEALAAHRGTLVLRPDK